MTHKYNILGNFEECRLVVRLGTSLSTTLPWWLGLLSMNDFGFSHFRKVI